MPPGNDIDIVSTLKVKIEKLFSDALRNRSLVILLVDEIPELVILAALRRSQCSVVFRPYHLRRIGRLQRVKGRRGKDERIVHVKTNHNRVSRKQTLQLLDGNFLGSRPGEGNRDRSELLGTEQGCEPLVVKRLEALPAGRKSACSSPPEKAVSNSSVTASAKKHSSSAAQPKVWRRTHPPLTMRHGASEHLRRLDSPCSTPE